ncbi:hypothetical protein ACWGCW_22530 [Streptomyces sp. NPDC054933]
MEEAADGGFGAPFAYGALPRERARRQQVGGALATAQPVRRRRLTSG